MYQYVDLTYDYRELVLCTDHFKYVVYFVSAFSSHERVVWLCGIIATCESQSYISSSRCVALSVKLPSLSFYKESMDGETNTYIYQRANAENADPLVVLRNLCDDTLDMIRRIGDLTSSDPQLADICRSYLMVSIVSLCY